MPKKQKTPKHTFLRRKDAPWQRAIKNRRFKIVFLSLAALSVAVVLAQLLYPVNQALPYAKLNDVQVGGKTFNEVIAIVRQNYTKAPLHIKAGGATILKTNTVEAGVVPGYLGAAEAVTEYPLLTRLVPFSSVYKMLQNPPLGYAVETERTDVLAGKIAEACYKDPTDAALRFDGGDVSLEPDKPGQRCEFTAVQDAFKSLSYDQKPIVIKVRASTIQAERTTAQFKSQFLQAQNVLRRGLTVRTTLEAWEVPAETLASWLTTVTTEGGKTVLATDSDAIKAFLAGKKGALHIEPGVTKIRYRDGMEVSRQTGLKGQGIDAEVTTQRISDALLGATPNTSAWVQLTVLEPKIETELTYSPSHTGLQALVEQWDRENSGRYGVLIYDLTGRGLNAALEPDRDFVTASTFKMFLAYAVLHKVEAGELNLSSQTDMGLSLQACLEEMILNSTNACATSLTNLAGNAYVHNFIRGQFPATTMDNNASNDGDKHTTTRDEANFLVRLNAGELLNGGNTDYLLGLLKRQHYRGGIPAGVPGIAVANKVGFYAGYKHDVAIVYAPRGTYVLAIMSYGGADWRFADLSRRVYQLMQAN